MPSLPQFIAEALREPRERAFSQRLGETAWTVVSSREMDRRARTLARALRAAAIAPGDRVALIANNRIDWLACDFGILYAGCVPVPVFATLALDQIDYILRDCAAKLAIVETPADAQRIRAGCAHAPRIVVMDGTDDASLAAFERSVADGADAEPPGFADPAADDDLAVLIYTSGTTGNPKGVMLTHRNLVSNACATSEWVFGPGAARRGDAVMTVLPYAHIYEHTDLLCALYEHADIVVTQPDFLLADLLEVRPRLMALVPRIFERVLAGIIGKAKAAGGAQARLVPWALETGRAYESARADGVRPGPLQSLRYTVARRLVLRKIAAATGMDRIDFFSSGSAPLHRDIALTFAGIGIPICEGYGLTETAPVVSATQRHAIRYGSVGKPIPGVEVRIASDGEILVRGPNVMKGYYNAPGEHPFTGDGFFMTGDIGELDADGYLFVTDRKKELIKTSAGKYVAPGRVEAALKRSPFVGQCFVLGDGRPYPIALVSPNWTLVRGELRIAADFETHAIAQRDDVHDLVLREVLARSSDLASFETIRKIALLPRDLTIEDGELSPTLKIKRRVVEKKFAQLIDAAYAR